MVYTQIRTKCSSGYFPRAGGGIAKGDRKSGVTSQDIFNLVALPGDSSPHHYFSPCALIINLQM